uniref:CRAL-TRIO domain-containing protein n=2 Tax=Odontella aurita TaxID=265563 RepID=A0A7S4JJS9_9STRA|mmetsp:Transcript_47615/g.144016  ORF Transcript_47615/g.144016 Transcript_47615/m.144016 type:complete len:492 (+) Transcript_47615:87-1562(+)
MRRSRPQVGYDGHTKQPPASHPTVDLLSVLDETEQLCHEYEIETILSKGAPVVAYSTGGAAVGSHLDHLPPSRPLGFNMGSMSADEEARLVYDVYGHKPPKAALMDERLDALEREIGRLGREERSSLDRARRHHPLLTIASPHVRDILLDDGYDAPSAARRLARYWKQREGLFGERAFSRGLLMQPDIYDYIEHYNRCDRAKDDPSVSEEMKAMAREYVRIVSRVKIEAMDKLIAEAPEKDREALVEAIRVNPLMAQSAEFKLLFLKCEDFVEARAAVRMMKYWAMKKFLFGPGRLGEEITLADVDDCVFDLDVIGHSLLVPGTDKNGRCVFWGAPNELVGRDGWTAEAMAQYMWCIVHIALAQPSCSEHGLVVMINSSSGFNPSVFDGTFAVRRLGTSIIMNCMPFRVCVVHCFFSPSSWWQSFMTKVLKHLSDFGTKRMVMHIGAFEENRTVLEGIFGIGPDQVITELGGNVDMDWWRGWIRERREEGK